ncbi:dirigent protein 17-like [Solanum verrucosum]|uniref:dirigent protein 17-like n=1 Tax=Solanum verrucosum TaxID=315347 RepID=UPI0020D1DAF4|nr:dirigent protein 17-like [Solanum verrucosum]
MDFSSKENDVEEFLPLGVFEILGDMIVVINELPPISSNINTFLPCPIVTDAAHKNDGFGQLFEGREVRKLFEYKYYNGKVTKYDEKTGWFRVKYKDVDNEDLKSHELKEVLQPLNINIPLKEVNTEIIYVELQACQNDKAHYPVSCASHENSETSCGDVVWLM